MISFVSKSVILSATSASHTDLVLASNWRAASNLWTSLRQCFPIKFIKDTPEEAGKPTSQANPGTEIQSFYNWEPKDWNLTEDVEFEKSSVGMTEIDSSDEEESLEDEYVMSII